VQQPIYVLHAGAWGEILPS